jgi:beta-phosphoglucomutase
MAALGIARLHDERLPREAGARLVLTSLDDVDVVGFAQGKVLARTERGRDDHA